MPGYGQSDDVEFHAEDYTVALTGRALSEQARTAAEELPDHPDLKAPSGPELESECRGAFVVGYVNGQPAASGGYRSYPEDESGETVEFVRLYVRPDARRTGLGRALLIELEERALDDGYQRAVLPVGIAQPAAQALFEFLGYRRLPGEPDAWGRVFYARDLPEDPAGEEPGTADGGGLGRVC
jgi:GNAT superfamily N-acetyltransferase